MLSFVCSTTRTAGICTGRFALFGVVLSKAYILLVIITLFKNSIHLSLSLWGLTGASWRVVTNELSHTKKSDNTGEHTKSKTPYALASHTLQGNFGPAPGTAADFSGCA